MLDKYISSMIEEKCKSYFLKLQRFLKKTYYFEDLDKVHDSPKQKRNENNIDTETQAYLEYATENAIIKH